MSNRLPTLAAEIQTAHAAAQAAEITAAERALEAGRALIEAKSLVQHGEWLSFLKDAGIPERTAQRYLALASSGLKSDTVSDLGGIKSALAFLSKWQMPKAGEALHVETGEEGVENFAFVWRDYEHPDHIVIAALVDDQSVRTKRPMLPLIEVEGDQPVDTAITWLVAQDFGSIGAWRVNMVDKRLADSVINPLVWSAMVEECSGAA